MSGGGKTTTKATENSTSQVQLPAWMSAAGEGLFNEARATSAANPITAYGGSITAPMAANQQTAQGVAAGQQNAGRPQTRAATAAAVGAMGGGSRVGSNSFDGAAADRYMSPFLEAVQGRTVQEMRRQGDMQLQDLGDNAQAQRSFGGIRHAVAEGEAAKGINNNILDYLARSNQAGFENAQGQFNTDENRRLSAQTTNAGLDQGELDRRVSAGGLLGQLGEQEASLRSQNIRDLLTTGGVAQETEDAARAAQYNEFLRMQDAPMDRYEQLMAILSGTPRNVTTTSQGTARSTQKQSGGLLNTLMGAAQIGAAVYCDRRLKVDVRLVRREADGLCIYDFRYREGHGLPSGVHRGPMADEVARFRPHALGPVVDGYATVLPDRLGLAA